MVFRAIDGIHVGVDDLNTKDRDRLDECIRRIKRINRRQNHGIIAGVLTWAVSLYIVSMYMLVVAPLESRSSLLQASAFAMTLFGGCLIGWLVDGITADHTISDLAEIRRLEDESMIVKEFMNAYWRAHPGFAKGGRLKMEAEPNT